MPVVARAGTGVPAWVIAVVALALGVVLFMVLDARRRALTAPAVRAGAGDGVTLSAPPALYVPPAPLPPPIISMPVVMPSPSPPAPAVRPTPVPPPTIVTTVQQPTPQPSVQPATVPARIATEPTLVIDNTAPTTPATQAAAGPNAQSQAGGGQTGQNSGVAGARASAGVLANRATTVPQGTLIPAVLETALDSTRPGLARAIVSRDIRGFDGSRVLVPRGSRLIGEYGTQIESGQNRLLVNWVRLIRPDGATVAIGSPAADTIGRGGIRASVNTHFFERFAGAILQSALDVGVSLAQRSVDSTVLLLPGTQSFRPTPSQIRPTLKVRAATSISIFVARDLDFTSVEAR